MDPLVFAILTLPATLVGYAIWFLVRLVRADKETLTERYEGIVLARRYLRGSDGNPRTYVSTGKNGNTRIGYSQGLVRSEEYRVAVLLRNGETLNVNDPAAYAATRKGLAVVVEVTRTQRVDPKSRQVLLVEDTCARIVQVGPQALRIA